MRHLSSIAEILATGVVGAAVAVIAVFAYRGIGAPRDYFALIAPFASIAGAFLIARYTATRTEREHRDALRSIIGMLIRTHERVADLTSDEIMCPQGEKKKFIHNFDRFTIIATDALRDTHEVMKLRRSTEMLTLLSLREVLVAYEESRKKSNNSFDPPIGQQRAHAKDKRGFIHQIQPYILLLKPHYT